MFALAKVGCGRSVKRGLGGSACGGTLRINTTSVIGRNSRYGRSVIPSGLGSSQGKLVSMARPKLLARKLPPKGASFSAVMMEQPIQQEVSKHQKLRQWVGSANLRQGLEWLQEAMVRERRLGPGLKTNISNLCGHASFVVLALAYLETDVLALREYAASGVGLSILFQFYRAQPLWIPIGWNAIFLGINLTMIGLLVNERNNAGKLEQDPEQAKTYRELFEPVDLSPVEFVRLMDLAERREMAKGELLSEENQVQEEVFLIVEGTAKVESEGVSVCHLEPKQFVGSMCFNRFMQASRAPPATSAPTMKTSDNSSSPSPPVRAAIKSAADDASKAVSVNAAAAAAAADEPEDHSALMYIDDSYIPGVGSGIEDYGNATLGLFPKDSLVGQATLDFIPSESIVGEVAKTFLDDSGGGGKPACTLERSLTTVTTTADDVVVYAWDMHLLRAFIKRRPLAGASIQKAISADLNRKVEQSRGHEERYRLLLVETLDGGVITPIEKKKLLRYRDAHNIPYEDHKDLLREHGWTEEEFEAGFQKGVTPRGGSKDFLKYEELVRRKLANGEVEDKERQDLREFRAQAGIDAQEHLVVLEKQGWTADDYEIGAKGKAAELETRSLAGGAADVRTVADNDNSSNTHAGGSKEMELKGKLEASNDSGQGRADHHIRRASTIKMIKIEPKAVPVSITTKVTAKARQGLAFRPPSLGPRE